MRVDEINGTGGTHFGVRWLDTALNGTALRKRRLAETRAKRRSYGFRIYRGIQSGIKLPHSIRPAGALAASKRLVANRKMAP